jgi:hypothetical protein
MSRALDRHETAVIARLVQLLAPRYPTLDAGARTFVERDVTAFVRGQIRSMPSFLRLPYRIALFGFNWLPVFRYRRPFRTLGDESARRYLSLWSERGLRPTRDFVKLIRSCALLAYFDHPQVRRHLEAVQPPQTPPQRAVGHGLD